MHGDEAVRVWRADVGAGAICMHGTTSSYAVDPVGEYVVGMVLAGGMRVRRGREVHRFAPGDVCAWDPSARHEGRPWRSARWQARLVVLELPRRARARPRSRGGRRRLVARAPRVRDPRLARRLPRAARRARAAGVEARARHAAAGVAARARRATRRPRSPRAARRDPALRRACELLGDDLAAQRHARRASRGGRRQPPPPDAPVPRRLRPAAAPLRARAAHPRRPPAARARRARPPRSPRRPASSTRATCTATSRARSG